MSALCSCYAAKMDVENAFVSADLEEIEYIRPLDGIVISTEKGVVRA